MLRTLYGSEKKKVLTHWVFFRRGESPNHNPTISWHLLLFKETIGKYMFTWCLTSYLHSLKWIMGNGFIRLSGSLPNQAVTCFNKSGCTPFGFETEMFRNPPPWGTLSLFEQTIGSILFSFNNSNPLSLRRTLIPQNKHHLTQNQTQLYTNPTIRNKNIPAQTMLLPSLCLITNCLPSSPLVFILGDYSDLISLEHNSD